MQYKIALAGNPNTGKTTLFNALTGSNQFVGNWPGVTVEKGRDPDWSSRDPHSGPAWDLFPFPLHLGRSRFPHLPRKGTA